MSALNQSISLNPLALIDRLIADIELTPTQYQSAKTSYETVAEVLNNADSAIHAWTPKIFPQGSMRIGTTIKPFGQNQFDLDMVCWLSCGYGHTPETVYEWVWKALGDHATYREMRRRKNRCIRLEYEGDYYLDIIPAIPDRTVQTESLFVPDRAHKKWCSSHPVGFADWFKRSSAQKPTFRVMFSANEARRAMSAKEVEPLPEYGEFEKTPLQRIVQMLKHNRDQHYEHNQECRPSSILLTTVTTRSYNKTVATPVDNLLEFVIKVIRNLGDHIGIQREPSLTRFYVMNPVNDEENFAENWTEKHYVAFCKWQATVLTWLNELDQSRGRGADNLLANLSTAFGDSRVIKAVNAMGTHTHSLHEAGRIRVDNTTARLGSLGRTVAPTIFFGSAE